MTSLDRMDISISCLTVHYPPHWYDGSTEMGKELALSSVYIRGGLLECGGVINSLGPGKFEQNFTLVIFKLISVTNGWGIYCKIALRWMPLDFTDNKSTLVQIMAWCRQATSHYLSQCWPRFMSPYGVTMPRWVNIYLKCSLYGRAFI